MEESWAVLKRNSNYAVSSMGRVKRIISYGCTWPGRILKFDHDKDGYVKVRLGSKGGRHSVHALVFESFCGSIPCGKECNHIDGDKTNNRPENLEYITNYENHQHAKKVGLKARGEKMWKAKLREFQIFDIIKRITNGDSCAEISKDYGVTPQAINRIKVGKSWGWLNAQ
jgi:hypothetical protein